MQYTIRGQYSTDRKTTQRSVRIERIERIVKPSDPFTICKAVFFLSVPNEMQYTIRGQYSTDRKTT